jgi:hypothetical protein
MNSLGKQEDQAELWIGLVELKPLNRKSYGAAGAFTTIVTWAGDEVEFRVKCQNIATTLDMFVADIEEAELLSERMKTVTLTEETEDMVLRAEGNPNAIVYGTFHRYPFDEA